MSTEVKPNRCQRLQSWAATAFGMSLCSPPRVPRWWRWLWWLLFAAGAAILARALVTIAGSPAKEAVISAQTCISAAMFGAFAGASLNTILAANWFGRREKYLRGRLDWLLENRRSSAETLIHDKESGITLDSGHWNRDEWKIRPTEPFEPAPLRGSLGAGKVTLMAHRWIDLIAAERHAARAEAASIAAALGGLFVASLQVFARLTDLAKSAGE